MSSIQSIVEETTQLSIKMCLADAHHDKTVNENVHRLQASVGELLELLSGAIGNIADRATVDPCLKLCIQARAIDERGDARASARAAMRLRELSQFGSRPRKFRSKKE